MKRSLAPAPGAASNSALVGNALQWKAVAEWLEGRRGGCYLLVGPSGVGKTYGAHLKLAAAGYRVVEYNACEVRTPEAMLADLYDVCTRSSSISSVVEEEPAPARLALLMDDVDTYAQPVIEAIVRFLRAPPPRRFAVPVVCTCQSASMPALKSLRALAVRTLFLTPVTDQDGLRQLVSVARSRGLAEPPLHEGGENWYEAMERRVDVKWRPLFDLCAGDARRLGIMIRMHAVDVVRAHPEATSEQSAAAGADAKRLRSDAPGGGRSVGADPADARGRMVPLGGPANVLVRADRDIFTISKSILSAPPHRAGSASQSRFDGLTALVYEDEPARVMEMLFCNYLSLAAPPGSGARASVDELGKVADTFSFVDAALRAGPTRSPTAEAVHLFSQHSRVGASSGATLEMPDALRRSSRAPWLPPPRTCDECGGLRVECLPSLCTRARTEAHRS